MSKTRQRISEFFSGNAKLPEKPQIALRIGFAGNRRLSAINQADLQSRVSNIIDALGVHLADLHNKRSDTRLSGLYSDEKPVLRLTTGLCEGSDDLAANALLDTKSHRFDRELGAVIPFSVSDYRQSRDVDYRPQFDHLFEQCQWLLTLDGIYDKPDTDSLNSLEPKARAQRIDLAKRRSSRAYRAQAEFMLRHTDILICAINLDVDGKPGGTAETMRAAHALGIPIILINIDPTAYSVEDEKYYLISANDSIFDSFDYPPQDRASLYRQCEKWVKQICASLDDATNESKNIRAHQSLELLKDFFHSASKPPTSTGGRGLVARFRERAWEDYERRFKKNEQSIPDDKPVECFEPYRKRASELSRFFIGRYRGAFLLNYCAAVMATLLATTGLFILSLKLKWYPLLLALALIELLLVSFIIWNTRIANNEQWNHSAIDLRFLTERLRTMFYLPGLFSLRPPDAGTTQLESRSVRQSAVDWLFQAICRSVSPTQLADTKESNTSVPVKLEIDPLSTLMTVRDIWIAGQRAYHHNTHERHHRMHEILEKWASRFGVAVLIIVVVDIFVLYQKVFESRQDWWTGSTPFLIALTAVLPAVIAAISGLVSQSESQSLSERAASMQSLLGKDNHQARIEDLIQKIEQSKQNPDTDPGSWSGDTLRYVEQLATDFSQEVSEWSVLYTNDVKDPG